MKITAGSIENYVYRVKYGRADCLGQALTQLFNPNYGVGGYGTGGSGGNGYGNGYGNQGYGNNNGYGNNGYGNNQGYGGAGGGGVGNAGGYGNQNNFNSNFGGSGGCNATGLGGGGNYNAGGGGYNNQQAYGYPAFGGYNAQTAAANGTGQTVAAAAGSPVGGAAATPATPAVPPERPPRIIPNPLDNKLIIQANAEQYQNILKILKELDVPPRQILLEAKIYSVTLSDGFTSDITATLAKAGTSLGAHQLLGNLTGGSLGLSAGTLVGQSRQLLLALSASENRSYTKLLSEPSLIATDSIPASITVGTQVPVSTGSTTVPSAGGAVVSQSVSAENTGITLQVNARVNSSGVVTLIINQENSSVNAGASNSSGTAFSQQVVQTQITMMDGDTIAIGGLIDENYTNNSSGIPGLIRLPWIGWLFGSKSVTKERDELIMFFTPHVIFDETQLIEASDELKTRVKLLKRDIRRM